MKTEIRALLNDFKAAARIGHRQSLEKALDSLRSLPEAASNRPVSEAFLVQVILPLGASLVSPRLETSALRPFLKDRLTAVRAVVAVALGRRFFETGDVAEQDLLTCGRDQRPEVRQALAKTLGEAGLKDPEGFLDLILPWLEDRSPYLRQTALLALAVAATRPSFSTAYGMPCLERMEPLHLDLDQQVQAGLAAALIALAGHGLAEAVLFQLKTWAGEPDPNAWVISQALSASWAAQHSDEAETILKLLEDKTGLTRQVTNARRALVRHTQEKAERDQGL